MNTILIHPSFYAIILLISFSVQSFAQKKNELLIVAFGNSTTAPREDVKKVFAVRVHEILMAYDLPNKVINAGVGSSHTGSIKDNDFAKVAHGMDRFSNDVLSLHPDLVILNFGLNDAWQDDGVNGTSRIPIQDYKRNISYFIDQIQRQYGKVILLPPNPIGPKFERSRYKRVKTYMKTAKKLAKEKKVPFLDTWKLFGREVKGDPRKLDALLTDGIHPGDRGHEIIANELSRIIVELYSVKNRKL